MPSYQHPTRPTTSAPWSAYALTLFVVLLAAPEKAVRAHELTLAGSTGITPLDAGVFIVEGRPGYARLEAFEFLKRADGGITLLSATTFADGSLRVRARYDYDAAWQAIAAFGRGMYEQEPVDVSLESTPGKVSVMVRGESTHIDASVPCPDGCFMDMGPSGSPMFVMTQRYDRESGGVQSFRWAAQDLRRPFTSPENQRAELRLRKEAPVRRADGTEVVIRAYDMVERIPTPDGSDYVMEFDLWTDGQNRPMGYRINSAGGKPARSRVVAFRQGYEDIRDALLGGDS